jgi:hypothetical protein
MKVQLLYFTDLQMGFTQASVSDFLGEQQTVLLADNYGGNKFRNV